MAVWNVCGDSMGVIACSALPCHLPSSPGPSPAVPETLRYLTAGLGLAIPILRAPPPQGRSTKAGHSRH